MRSQESHDNDRQIFAPQNIDKVSVVDDSMGDPIDKVTRFLEKQGFAVTSTLGAITEDDHEASNKKKRRNRSRDHTGRESTQLSKQRDVERNTTSRQTETDSSARQGAQSRRENRDRLAVPNILIKRDATLSSRIPYPESSGGRGSGFVRPSTAVQ